MGFELKRYYLVQGCRGTQGLMEKIWLVQKRDSKTMITYLNLEQETLIQVVRTQWIKLFLDTAPIDKQKAEIAITNL